jgi:hypothetical protein
MKRVVPMLAVAASLGIGAAMAQPYNAPAGGIPTPTNLTPTGDSTLGRMAGDIEGAYNTRGQIRNEEWDPQGKATTRSMLSDSPAIGGAINSLASGARNAADLWDASNLLDQLRDHTYEPVLTDAGPDVPGSLCGASANCNLCFSQATSKVDFMRFNLEKLRVAGQATRDTVSYSYSIGDSLSGAFGFGAVGWQIERKRIGQEFDKFKQIYDAKYEGMMKGFKDALDRWNACEEQYGERDWYSRFGFLYYDFMRDRYKRNF